MKKLVVISIMAAMLLVVSVAVMADATNWMLKIGTTNLAGLYPGGDVTIGWWNAYTDGVNTGETTSPTAPGPGGKLASIGSIIPGTTKPVTRDFRTPLALDPTLPKIWTLAIFTQGPWDPADNIRITFKPQAGASGAFPGTDPAFPPGAVVKISGVGIDSTFTVAEFAAKVNPTTWYYDISAKDANGALYTIDNPYLLTVMVPEPSSMLALASGLAGLVGFGIRRRRA